MNKMFLKLSRALALCASFMSPADAGEGDNLYYGYNPPDTQSMPYLIDFNNQVLNNYLKPDPKSEEGFFVVASAFGYDNKTALILYIAKDFSNAANVNSSDGIVLLNKKFTANSELDKCLFIASNAAQIDSIGANQKFSMFVLELSDAQIKITEKADCVAFERRSGPRRVNF